MRLPLQPAGLFGRRIVREGAWVAAGQIASAAAAIVSIRIMTELLTPDEFGRLTLLVGLAALALGISVEPRLQAVMRSYADAAREGRIGNLRAIGVRLVAPMVAGTALLIAGGGFVAGPWRGEPWFAGVLVAVMLLVDCLRMFEMALFSAARRQRAMAAIYAADAWSRPLMAVAAVLAFGASAESALAGYVGGSAAVVLAMRAFMRLEGVGEAAPPRDMSKDAELAAAMRRYALPLAPLAILGWFNGIGDRYVIGGMIGLHEAGLYAAAYGLVSKPFLMLGTMAELLMRPILFDAVAADDAGARRRAKLLWFALVGGGSAFGVLCFLVLGPYVAAVVLAADYRETAVAMMGWIALGYAFYVMSVVNIRLCYAFHDTRAALLLTIASSAVMLATLLVFLKLYGLLGAAMAVPVYFGFQWAMAAALARRAERNWRTGRRHSGQQAKMEPA